MEKYEEMRKFSLENFETTKDRLHTQDILDILSRNGFSFDSGVMGKYFKSMEIGKHRSSCVINSQKKKGYYNIRYKGAT